MIIILIIEIKTVDIYYYYIYINIYWILQKMLNISFDQFFIKQKILFKSNNYKKLKY